MNTALDFLVQNLRLFTTPSCNYWCEHSYATGILLFFEVDDDWDLRPGEKTCTAAVFEGKEFALDCELHPAVLGTALAGRAV